MNAHGLPNDKTDIRVIKPYLKAFIDHMKKSPNWFVYDFFQVSSYTLEYKVKKFMECKIKKSSGGHNKDIKTCKAWCGQVFSNWRDRWLTITEEGLFHMRNPEIPKVTETLLFDHNFSIDYGFMVTGRRKGLLINTSSRKLKIEADNYFSLLEILKSFNWAAKKSPYIQLNRFTSFAPVRSPNASVQWYINGEHYFPDVCDALLSAKEEVYITDWWLSPELYLKRPKEGNEDSRIDRVLGEIAMRGVKVNIIVYKEVTFALYNDSEHCQEHLQKLSKNIRVIRHPNNFVFLWSHHEKMCVVDQKIGFMGGLDLCFGRYDTYEHPLADNDENYCLFPGIDYTNSRICDFRNVRCHEKALVSRSSVPRMPWRDIALRVIGEPVKDLVRHFIQYWNFTHIDLATEDLDQLIKLNKQTTQSSNIAIAKKNVMAKLRKKNSAISIVKYWGGDKYPRKSSAMIDAYVEAQKKGSNANLNLVDLDNKNLKKLKNSDLFDSKKNKKTEIIIKKKEADDKDLLTNTLSNSKNGESFFNVDVSEINTGIANSLKKTINLDDTEEEEEIKVAEFTEETKKQEELAVKRKSMAQTEIVDSATRNTVHKRKSAIQVEQDFNNLIKEAHLNAEDDEHLNYNTNKYLLLSFILALNLWKLKRPENLLRSQQKDQAKESILDLLSKICWERNLGICHLMRFLELADVNC